MTDAETYFAAKLRHETDASDVYEAQRAGTALTIVDVRSDAAWAQGRVAGAVHLPYREIPARATAEIDRATPVVVYCWGPGCNAGAKAALAFAAAGYSVREMIGGYEYWVREGLPTQDDDGPLARRFDPLTMVVR
ncbi:MULTISPECIES: rhodanese-like domain-containing protein [unclassified Microbacterium]|uniref:rhodanese-like domain-containing protein n=1 Tax=unclassified Microbacterium TaxID=2609290 RepID=UPI00214BDB13|nr:MULTISPECIES: rhodanese-like domain-containing protein [unclassified Microbacterium]MCR2800659.1 rhodanese-like domain-containing protein [Microbacterium sp. zg.Y818]MCR2828093.1 rhodanese-like domain-containing protein [Microbacterium sp. zg.Y909]WIM23384.1 rhodanese-like domain-containing protein [Microbacterium sp. zg-Y818]